MERKGVSKLLARARRKLDKPMQTSNGTKVRFMVPHILEEPLSSATQSNGSKVRTAMLLCLPYFCLERYSGYPVGSHPQSHPMRTLLQARFSLTQKERDMRQAVCHLPDTPEGYCFHIAQLWCIVVDECELQSSSLVREDMLTQLALLFTCARLPMSALQGESISIVSTPAIDNPRLISPTLLVSSGRSLLWSFPLDECKSWFVSDQRRLHF
jgi:hypothetical protein